MHEMARRPDRDRADLFRAASQAMGVAEAIVEKDFWVCWTLDYLFRESPWKAGFAFKGGTSLSKAYGLIERFSEDIDLIIDWPLLGYDRDEAWQERSPTQQDRFGKAANERTAAFLTDSLGPNLRTSLGARLGREVVIRVEGQDLLLEYPAAFPSTYIRPEIKLEIGPLAAGVPNEDREVRPYAAERFPALFSKPSVMVRTVVAKRTFWEKATILHQLAHQGPEKPPRSRYSRHYYDLYRMIQGSVRDSALADLELLHDVAAFKIRFYRCPWARYEEAKPGSLRLLPPEHHLPALRDDYLAMRSMLFGAVPSFDEILSGIRAFEVEVNRLA